MNDPKDFTCEIFAKQVCIALWLLLALKTFSKCSHGKLHNQTHSYQDLKIIWSEINVVHFQASVVSM